MAKKAGVSADNRQIAKHIAVAFGSQPEVRSYDHDSEELSIDLAYCADRPNKGIVSYSTIGLSDTTMIDKKPFASRIELAGISLKKVKYFPNILASAAFIVMRTKRFIYPGAVIADLVVEYYPKCRLRHLYFTSPFVWENSLAPLDLSKKSVRWLLAFPISETELRYLLENGDEAFEQRMETNDIDFTSIERPIFV